MQPEENPYAPPSADLGSGMSKKDERKMAHENAEYIFYLNIVGPLVSFIKKKVRFKGIRVRAERRDNKSYPKSSRFPFYYVIEAEKRVRDPKLKKHRRYLPFRRKYVFFFDIIIPHPDIKNIKRDDLVAVRGPDTSELLPLFQRLFPDGLEEKRMETVLQVRDFITRFEAKFGKL